uniref:Uncharacterized protein n=1 Tax=Triticum urartu TaxID=4572 RepID=A0A8R7P452_TRIUA
MTFSLYRSSSWSLVLALPALSSTAGPPLGTTAPENTTPNDPSPMRSPTTKSLILRLRRPSSVSSACCSGANTYVSTAPLSTPGRAVRYSHVTATTPNSAHRSASFIPAVSSSIRDSASSATRTAGLDASRFSAERSSSGMASTAAPTPSVAESGKLVRTPSGTTRAALALADSPARGELRSPSGTAAPMDDASLAAGSDESACSDLLSSVKRSPQPSVPVSLTTVATTGSGLTRFRFSAPVRSSSPAPPSVGAAPHLVSRCLAPCGWSSAWYLLAKVGGGRREEEAMERMARLSWEEVEARVFERWR